MYSYVNRNHLVSYLFILCKLEPFLIFGHKALAALYVATHASPHHVKFKEGCQGSRQGNCTIIVNITEKLQCSQHYWHGKTRATVWSSFTLRKQWLQCSQHYWHSLTRATVWSVTTLLKRLQCSQHYWNGYDLVNITEMVTIQTTLLTL